MLIQRISGDEVHELDLNLDLELDHKQLSSKCDKTIDSMDGGHDSVFAGAANIKGDYSNTFYVQGVQLAKQAAELSKEVFFVYEGTQYSYWFIASTFEEVVNRIN